MHQNTELHNRARRAWALCWRRATQGARNDIEVMRWIQFADLWEGILRREELRAK